MHTTTVNLTVMNIIGDQPLPLAECNPDVQLLLTQDGEPASYAEALADLVWYAAMELRAQICRAEPHLGAGRSARRSSSYHPEEE